MLGGQPAERVVDRTLRAHKDLDAAGRKAVSELVFNVGLWRRRLAFHARSEAPGAQAFALLHVLVGLPRAEAAGLAGVAGDTFLDPTEPPTTALRWSFPDWLVEHLEAELGRDGADALCRALDVPGPVALRVNPLKADLEGLTEELAACGVAVSPGTLSPRALLVDTRAGRRPNLYGLPALQEGRMEVQDEGSQLLGLLVEARPGQRVVDVCAGAGGKTLLLGGEMHDQGRLDAHDADDDRLERLRLRVSRAGLTCVRVRHDPPGPPGAADAALVDAPCSELGSLRRGPDLRFRLTPADLTRWPVVQRRLLDDGAGVVGEGGRLVYATCTLNRRENEDLVRGFLADRPGWRLAPLPAWLPPGCASGPFFRVLPHTHGTDGFFAAVLVRGAG